MATSLELINLVKTEERSQRYNLERMLNDSKRRDILDILREIKNSNPICLQNSSADADELRNELNDIIMQYEQRLGFNEGFLHPTDMIN